MKMHIRILIAAALVLCLVAAGSAYKLERADVVPDGDLQAGVPVTVNAVIDFSTTAGTTFPTEDTFQLYTELDKPKWSWAVVISGNENPKPESYGRFLKITGFELEYPKENSVKLRVTLDGTVPQINTTQNLTLARFQWLDSSSKVRENGEQSIVRKIVNPQDVAKSLETGRDSLKQLRSQIDAATAQGVNTTDAEAKYRAADQALKAASGGNFSSTTGGVEQANAQIEAAKKSLDQASAQKEIDRATTQIKNVDEMLTFFKSSKSLASDPRVAAITIKRESAQQSLTSATDSLAAGNYNQARVRGNESATKALEAYNDSVQLKSEFAGSGNQTTPAANATGAPTGGGGSMLPYILVVVVIALVVVGIVVYQRRNSWDELG